MVVVEPEQGEGSDPFAVHHNRLAAGRSLFFYS
jgi:hypothetical protein